MTATAYRPEPAPPGGKLRSEELNVWFGDKQVLRDVSLSVPPRQVTALIGPSGCGKSTFLRCMNRMHELVPGAHLSGRILLDDMDIHHPSVDPIHLRRRVGMVFQKPNPFPTMSIRDNVLAGLRLTHRLPPDPEVLVRRALEQAALWDEVKDRLGESAGGLSGGQQQRLCIARAVAVEPEVLLMDEPCSALDPIATARIEDLVHELKATYTVVMVTHNMQQAQRVAERTAFLYMGELVEAAPTPRLFGAPEHARTRAYLAGEFG